MVTPTGQLRFAVVLVNEVGMSVAPS